MRLVFCLFLVLTLATGSNHIAYADTLPQSDPSIISVQSIRAGTGDLAFNLTGLPLLPEGSAWNHSEGWVFPSSRSLIEVDLGAVQEIRALIVQADNNDSYVVEISQDRQRWERIWMVPPRANAQGMLSRLFELPVPAPARFVRIRPDSGDGRYALGRVVLLKSIPPWWDSVAAAALQANDSFLTEKRVDSLRPLVALFGSFALLWCIIARVRNARPGVLKFGQVLLGTAGCISLMCWWNFFNFHFPSSVHLWDFYHYYIGAKYFPELGYTGIYECTAKADVEAGFGAEVLKTSIRDLRTNALVPASRVLAVEKCSKTFSDERWRQFSADVAWFRSQNSWPRWVEQRQDHGYNGSPVWNLFASFLTGNGTVSDSQVTALAAVDSLLLIVMWGTIYWAFGFETACAAAIYWGCNFPGRFFWTGGSLLRHDWLCHLVVSICLLKRGFPFSSGAFIAYATLLRIFPGFILLGAAAQALYVWISTRRFKVSREQKRFAGGFIAVTLALILLGKFASGRESPYQEFIGNCQKHLATALTNNMGLGMLLSYREDTRAEVLKEPTAPDPYARWKYAHRQNIAERAYLYWVVAALYLVLLIYATRNIPLWAALCLGSTAIPVFTELTCYYYSALVLLGLLWTICPLGVLGLAMVAWLTSVLASTYSWYDVAYTAMSAVIIAYILLLLPLISSIAVRHREH